MTEAGTSTIMHRGAMPMTVYFFPTDAKGRETEAREVVLTPEGADISALPEDLRDHIQIFGVLDVTRTVQLFPKDGEDFLEALLSARNVNWHFRLTPQKIAL